MAPAMASPPAGIHGGIDGPNGRSMLSVAVAPAVVTVNVLETGEPPDGATLDGENAHAAIPGNVPQENFTVPE
jgi:phage tail tape-measure protein